MNKKTKNEYTLMSETKKKEATYRSCLVGGLPEMLMGGMCCFEMQVLWTLRRRKKVWKREEERRQGKGEGGGRRKRSVEWFTTIGNRKNKPIMWRIEDTENTF